MTNTREGLDTERVAAFEAADRAYTFGPDFFLTYLRRFVRERCPESAEDLPTVQIVLANGESLDLCHVVGVSERWALLAVWDADCDAGTMAMEIVPYGLIGRVSIRSRHRASGAIGFEQTHGPKVVSAEALLRGLVAQERGDNAV